ncbi:MAG: hypothetical protein SOX83_00165, partial [Sodaliphilus sp.]|nr:hypothetical protein [Sodaliphilus sp.]
PPTQTVSTKKRFPKNRENDSIAVIFFQKNALCPQKSPKNTYIFSAFNNLRPPLNAHPQPCPPSKPPTHPSATHQATAIKNSPKRNSRALL